MTDVPMKMTLQEAAQYFIDIHTTRINELAELDVKKESAAAIVILQYMVNDFTNLCIASHIQVAHEYFTDIEKSIELSVDGDYPVFDKLNELKMFLEAARNVGQRRRIKQMKPLLDEMVQGMRPNNHNGYTPPKN
jgi:hypothetical protein